MQLFEVKNDIAKILYSPNEAHLLLADFLLIEDTNQSLIAQIIDIESTEKDEINLATVKFSLSINKNANLSTYNGYTPAKDANIIYIDPKEIAQLTQSNKTNIFWGNLASHPNIAINLGLNLLRERPYIQCDKVENATTITTNILYSLQENRKRTIVIDFDGRYRKIEDATRISISKEYRLPLNFNAFDFISEHDLEDCQIENKAIIQGILLELQSYVDSLEDKFIPFEVFKSVIDEQCKQNPIPELIIFKNKLIKYQQKGLFAQNKDQFSFLDKILSKTSVTIIDASNIEEKWHRFIVETIASQIEKKCYFIINLNNSNSSKETLNTIYENENLRPIPVSNYKYYLVPELKALCKNLILFAPIEKTNDFEIYNSFLQKLNQKEFIIWSENTFYMPLILKLKAIEKASISKGLEEEIKSDVDQIFMANEALEQEVAFNNSETELQIDTNYDEFENEYLDEDQDISTQNIAEEDFGDLQPLIDDVTDDDLDYLDAINMLPQEQATEPAQVIQEAEEVEPQVIEEEIPIIQEAYSRAIEIKTFEDAEEEIEDDDIDDEEYIAPSQQRPLQQAVPEIQTQTQQVPAPSIKTIETLKQQPAEIPLAQRISEPPIPTPIAKKPSVPIYEAKIAEEPVSKNLFKEGNFVFHAKYGKGIVEKIIAYGNKTLLSIQFDNVGRRLLDPNLADIQLV